MKFSANLGFLWTDRSLPDAIHAAKAAGFAAVECHWPYDTPPKDVRGALEATNLPMLSLNTVRGDPGENGLSACPGREIRARAAIRQAIDYAQEIDATYIHVMAGNAEGNAARKTFLANLTYARNLAPDSITFLIEPLNRFDAPEYFLRTTDQAKSIVEDLADPGIKVMFDCYHAARTEGDVTARLQALQHVIGHVQIASVPDRKEPDHGELDYAQVFQTLEKIGWTRPIGAEYKPSGKIEENLNWLAPYL